MVDPWFQFGGCTKIQFFSHHRWEFLILTLFLCKIASFQDHSSSRRLILAAARLQDQLLPGPVPAAPLLRHRRPADRHQPRDAAGGLQPLRLPRVQQRHRRRERGGGLELPGRVPAAARAQMAPAPADSAAQVPGGRRRALPVHRPPGRVVQSRRVVRGDVPCDRRQPVVCGK